MNPLFLLVIEERELRDWLRHHRDMLWPDATVTDTPPVQFQAGLSELNLEAFDLIALSANCGDALADSGDGLDALRALQTTRHCPAVIVLAAGGNELSAVEAMRIGAVDYLPRSLLNAQRMANALRLAQRGPRGGKSAPPRTFKPARLELDPAYLDLPQYSLLHKLGESSRAAVYLAYSATLGRNVALKISKPALESNDECQEFAREYAAISALHNPAVVDIYDYGFHDGREFIAMEYFPCGDLKTRLQQPMSVAEALGYALRICGALRVIHAAGLIHRDLKPPNVMLREDGSVVLIDFGIAKGIDSTGHSTAIGVLRGSPYYMSPEQAQGVPLDARSDLYSAGVMLFELLTGAKPYVGNSAVEVMQQHVHGPRP